MSHPSSIAILLDPPPFSVSFLVVVVGFLRLCPFLKWGWGAVVSVVFGLWFPSIGRRVFTVVTFIVAIKLTGLLSSLNSARLD